MGASGKRVEVYHATPLYRKCDDELSKVQKASVQAGTEVKIRLSPWKRIKYGLKFLIMPVVVVDNKVFSVLWAFHEESLIAELTRKESRAAAR